MYSYLFFFLKKNNNNSLVRIERSSQQYVVYVRLNKHSVRIILPQCTSTSVITHTQFFLSEFWYIIVIIHFQIEI